MNIIERETLGEAWLQAMELAMKQGELIHDDGEELREVLNLYITLSDAREEDVVLVKYADKDRIALMKKKYSTCGLVGDYKIDYGSYIFDNNGINQMDWVKKRIDNKPETKSATITLHRPGEDMLACLSLLDFKLRNGKLNMNVVYRSQNIFASQPGNIIALRQMQSDLAEKIGVPTGKIELVVFSAHIYARDYEAVSRILNKEVLL